ncbi:hypothetical protein [Clostridium perfringens]|uniref:hypothetical protein n=1 Tax=Clostridium perfringens TaxID=1502 RepID=UPI0023412105|nr:hypothetical protein [Clostridium perfringens]MDC4245540.1 hypothetical protein [Clostridium perfringens]
MQLILNEYRYVEEILNNLKNIKVDTTKKIIVLIKHYKSIGMNREQILGRIQDIMMNNYPEFNLSLWDEFLRKLVKTYSNSKYTLRQIKNIDIYKEEMDYITSKKDSKLERILFMMLVYAKIGGFNGWINTDISNVFRDAKASSTRKNMYLYIHKLKEIGMVDIQKQVDGRNVKIDFMKDEGEVVISISDFVDPIMDYYQYIGQKVKVCEGEGCSKRILVKGKKNTSQKYCRDCQKKILQQQKNEWKKRNKSKEKA